MNVKPHMYRLLFQTEIDRSEFMYPEDVVALEQVEQRRVMRAARGLDPSVEIFPTAELIWCHTERRWRVSVSIRSHLRESFMSAKKQARL